MRRFPGLDGVAEVTIVVTPLLVYVLAAAALSSSAFYVSSYLRSLFKRRRSSSTQVYNWENGEAVGRLDRSYFEPQDEPTCTMDLNSGMRLTPLRSQIVPIDGQLFLVPVWLKEASETVDRLKIVNDQLQDIRRLFLSEQVRKESYVEMVNERIGTRDLRDVARSLSKLNDEALRLRRDKLDSSKELAALKAAYDAGAVGGVHYRGVSSRLVERYRFTSRKLDLLDGLRVELSSLYDALYEAARGLEDRGVTEPGKIVKVNL